jgi:hypothetical protein
LALDVILKATPARLWDAHIKGMKDWEHFHRLMQIHYGHGQEEIAHKYIGERKPMGHVEGCRVLWHSISKIKWTHIFIHTLERILKNWYLELEMRGETT